MLWLNDGYTLSPLLRSDIKQKAIMAAVKRSPVWQFFTNNDSESGQIAACKECNATVKRKNNTSNLIHHLKQHRRLFDEYERLAALEKPSKSKQATTSATVISSDDQKSDKQTKLTFFSPLSKPREEEITNAMLRGVWGLY